MYRKLFLGALLIVANFAFMFYMLDRQKKAIDVEVEQLYFIHLVQARQVRTLQNLEMRKLRPDIQKRLAEIKERYDKLDKEEQDADKSE
tara:strand:+ start:644 stop:910 length:267 start_codon:yes stop_codon:yes gene_type:complete